MSWGCVDGLELVPLLLLLLLRFAELLLSLVGRTAIGEDADDAVDAAG